MLYLDISILGHFHLHQTIYKILCMNCSAGKTVNIPLSAYMPFGWIVCPSVISSDSTVLKSQTLSSTAQQIWTASKASDTKFSDWRDYHWSVYEIQWWAHDTSSLDSSPIHAAGIWAQTQDLETPGETWQWQWEWWWEQSGQLPNKDTWKKVNEPRSKKSKTT